MTRIRALACMPALGFVVVVVLVQSNWSPLRRLDVTVDSGLVGTMAPHPALVTTWRVVSTVGQPLTFQVLAVLSALVLARRRPGVAIWAVTTVLLAGPLSTLVKWLVDRPRPATLGVLSPAAGSSFPSGHALSSLVGVTVLLLVWSTSRTRPIAVPVGVVVIVLVGFSRLALGVHYLSDVLAGWLLGGTWVLLTRGLAGHFAGPGSGRFNARRPPERASASPDRPRRTSPG